MTVAVRPRRGRSTVLLVASIGLMVCYALALVLLGLATQTVPGLAPLLVLFTAIATVTLVFVLLQTVAVRGPALVVDDAGIRLRDLLGWTQVPWTTLRALTTSSGGRTLDLDAPGGVYFNDTLTRRSRQRYRVDGLEVRSDHLLTYLQHRHATAPRH